MELLLAYAAGIDCDIIEHETNRRLVCGILDGCSSAVKLRFPCDMS